MLQLVETVVIIAIVAVINAAISLISPQVGLFALLLTGPLTIAAVLRRR